MNARLLTEQRLSRIEIISYTPDSAANEHLEYVPLEEALKLSTAQVPSHLGHEVLHAEHARLCWWQLDLTPTGDGLLTLTPTMSGCSPGGTGTSANTTIVQ